MESIVASGQDPTAVEAPANVVHIDYVNYRGERGVRRIVPRRIYFGEVEWHSGPQWLLDAWDLDKDAMRSFAMRDVCAWDV